MTFSMSPMSPSTKIDMKDEVGRFKVVFLIHLCPLGRRGESSSEVTERSGGGESSREKEAAEICE